MAQGGVAGLDEGFPFTGNVAADAPGFLVHHGRGDIALHAAAVADRARLLAAAAGLDAGAMACAGLVHDIGLVVPAQEMVRVAGEMGVDVLPEERKVPVLLHGKLSAVFAREMFGIVDQMVIDAVRCHTTLRAHATIWDKVLFVADKLCWDPDDAPFHRQMLMDLEVSLDRAVRCFLRWTWRRRDGLFAMHPWLRQACEEMGVAGAIGGR